MRFVDPYALKNKPTRDTVVFAASQLSGKKLSQCDYFLNFNDECFVLADGLDTLPHSAVGAKFVCETAIWAYKHIRQHRYYWADKKLFMKRIFRTTNLAIWQKRKETGYEEGMATSLTVLLVGPKHYWVGSSGPSFVWLSHSGKMTKLTPEVSVFESNIHLLGMRRLGIIPAYKTAAFDDGDVLVLSSSGCGNYVTPGDLQAAIAMADNTTEHVLQGVLSLLHAAQTNGSEENATVIIVKRIDN